MKKLISCFVIFSLLLSAMPAAPVYAQSGKQLQSKVGGKNKTTQQQSQNDLIPFDPNALTINRDKYVAPNDKIQNNISATIEKEQTKRNNSYCGNSPEHKQKCFELWSIRYILMGTNTGIKENLAFKIPGKNQAEQLQYIVNYLQVLSLGDMRMQSWFNETVADLTPVLANLITIEEPNKSFYIKVLKDDLFNLSECAGDKCGRKLGSMVTLAMMSKGDKKYEADTKKLIYNTAMAALQKQSGMSSPVLVTAITALVGLKAKSEVTSILYTAAQMEGDHGFFAAADNVFSGDTDKTLKGLGQVAEMFFNPQVIGHNAKTVVMHRSEYKEGEISKAGAYTDSVSSTVPFEANIWEDIGLLLARDPDFYPIVQNHIINSVSTLNGTGIKTITMNPFIIGALRSGKIDLSGNKKLSDLGAYYGTTATGFVLSCFYDAQGMDAVSLNALKKRVYRAYQIEAAKHPSITVMQKPPAEATKGEKIRNDIWNYTDNALGVLNVVITIYFGALMLKAGLSLLANMGNIVKMISSASGATFRVEATLVKLKNLPAVAERLKGFTAAEDAAKIAADGAKTGEGSANLGKNINKVKNEAQSLTRNFDGAGLNEADVSAAGKGGGTGAAPTVDAAATTTVNSAPSNVPVRTDLPSPVQVTKDNAAQLLAERQAYADRTSALLDQSMLKQQQLASIATPTEADITALNKVNGDITALQKNLQAAQTDIANINKVNSTAKPAQPQSWWNNIMNKFTDWYKNADQAQQEGLNNLFNKPGETTVAADVKVAAGADAAVADAASERAAKALNEALYFENKLTDKLNNANILKRRLEFKLKSDMGLTSTEHAQLEQLNMDIPEMRNSLSRARENTAAARVNAGKLSKPAVSQPDPSKAGQIEKLQGEMSDVNMKIGDKSTTAADRVSLLKRADEIAGELNALGVEDVKLPKDVFFDQFRLGIENDYKSRLQALYKKNNVTSAAEEEAFWNKQEEELYALVDKQWAASNALKKAVIKQQIGLKLSQIYLRPEYLAQRQLVDEGFIRAVSDLDIMEYARDPHWWNIKYSKNIAQQQEFKKSVIEQIIQKWNEHFGEDVTIEIRKLNGGMNGGATDYVAGKGLTKILVDNNSIGYQSNFFKLFDTLAHEYNHILQSRAENLIFIKGIRGSEMAEVGVYQQAKLFDMPYSNSPFSLSYWKHPKEVDSRLSGKVSSKGLKNYYKLFGAEQAETPEWFGKNPYFFIYTDIFKQTAKSMGISAGVLTGEYVILKYMNK